MSTFVVSGGKVSEEGHGKPWLHLYRQGAYARGLNVTQRSAGANMSVDVNLDSSGFGSAFVATAAGVSYFGWTDSTVNVTVTTSNPSNPRIDTVVGYVDLSLITSSTTNNVGSFKVIAVPGTAAASPTAPTTASIQAAIGSGNPYLILADIAVGAAASNIVTGNITDRRVPAAVMMSYLWGGSNSVKGHQVPNVADGMVVTTSDTNTVSAPMLATSAITLGYAQIVTNASTTSTSAAQVPGLTLAPTIPAGGRRVKITAFAEGLYTSTGAAIVIMSIWDGAVGTGTRLTQAKVLPPGAGQPIAATAIAVVTPGAGAKTYNVALETSNASNAANLEAGATFPAFLLVEAI